MSSNTISGTSSKEIRRICYLARNFNMNKMNSEMEFHKQILRKNSKSFTQKILLYLAEESQKRHQREMKITKLTNVFGVPLDDLDANILTLPSRKRSGKIKKGTKEQSQKTILKSDGETQRIRRASSMSSETSTISLVFDEDHTHADTSHRTRALSMGVLQEVSEGDEKRRLSAPEVVVTPVVTKNSHQYLKRDKQLGSSSRHLTPRNSFSENEDALLSPQCPSPTSSFSPLRPHRVKSGKHSRKKSSSSFKTYSRASSLLRRLSSRDSSGSRRRSMKQDFEVPFEDIPNPLQDQRFLDLLKNLYIVPDQKEKVVDRDAVSE